MSKNNMNNDVIQDSTLQTNYEEFIEKVEHKTNQEKIRKERFNNFSERENRSVLDESTMENLSHGKYMTCWKGLNLMKDPLDFVIYQQLIWHEKPRAIFEMGSYTGASALWMADIFRLYGLVGHVYSVDINIEMVDEKAKQDQDITFIQGDLSSVQELFPVEMLEKIPHPWVIIEDAHCNIIGVMQHFDKFMRKGDYFIIDDTSPISPLVSGQGLFDDIGYTGFGIRKLQLVEEFLKSRPNTYKVDSFYTDYFGYNGTFNWNGYLKKVA